MESKPTKDGHIYLTYIYTKNVTLPGLTIHFLNGPSRMEGDNPFFENLYVSQEPRAFLENLQTSRLSGEESKILPLTQLEETLESIVRARVEQALNAIRERAMQIAPSVGMQKEFRKLNSLISDLLATGRSKKSSESIWLRADLKWYAYEPKPTVKTLKDFVTLVEEDEHACFSG